MSRHTELLLLRCLMTSYFYLQCVPYLIAMGTDPEPAMRNKADQQLVEIDKKYAGFIHVCIFKLYILNLNIVLW